MAKNPSLAFKALGIRFKDRNSITKALYSEAQVQFAKIRVLKTIVKDLSFRSKAQCLEEVDQHSEEEATASQEVMEVEDTASHGVETIHPRTRPQSNRKTIQL